MGGSGGGHTTMTGQIDYEYNARMATIAEAQQGMSEEMMGYYRDYGLPLDSARATAQLGLLPSQTAYESDALHVGRQGLGLQSQMYSAMSDAGLPQQIAGVRSQFLQEAREGIDLQARMGMAQADVAKGFEGAMGQQRMQNSRMGLQPGSGAAQGQAQDLAINRAGMMAGARTQARAQGEQEQFGRLQHASAMGLG